MSDAHNRTSIVLPIVPAIPVFMFVVGVVGNITAIAVLSKSKRERKESAFYTLVCGLAVTDLLGTCLASPITIATYMDNKWPGTLCEFHSFLLLFFGVAGLSIICAMSAERYLAISHPYSYKRWSIDQHVARWSLFAIYAGNVLFCCLPLMGFSESVHQPPDTWCFIDWRSEKPLHVFYSFLYAGVSSLLMLVTVACNVALCWTLLVMRRRSRSRLVPRPSIKDHWRALSSGVEIQMMILLVVTSLVVLVCSTPLVVRVFINQITLVWDGDADLQAIRLASINPILDPWVYILIRRSVFHKLLGLWRWNLRGRKNSVLPDRPQPTVQYLLEKSYASVFIRPTELLGCTDLENTSSTTDAVFYIEETERAK
ncbi:prostaglandin E2 receptor EP4 subtype-like [Megalops cyprinoides]|uniref:prostaglandin E2 receptor EP4 subtype-like n=1 Tax=Megalops cyprinoides TaxID=118141 RepID=UPI00186474D9|nr:prostaglandin E2 receptor EP4 subtype-like [Megalops cyprinoides]